MQDEQPALSRRELLRVTSAIAAGASLGPLLTACSPAAEPPVGVGHWRNWSGSVEAAPRAFHRPDSTEALQRILRENSGEVRAVGAGHSFAPVAASDDSMISLESLRGLIGIDRVQGKAVARFYAGTSIRDAARLLHDSGYGFANQGDVDPQALAGAVSTATHGTGAELASFSGMLRGATLVTAEGSLLTIDDSTPELLAAASTAIGSLGVFSELALAVQPRYRLHEREYTLPLKDIMLRAEALRDAHRHFEFFGFFGSGVGLVKTLDPTQADITPPGMLQLPVNTALRLASETVLRYPGSAQWVQRMLTSLAGSEERVDWSHRIFPSARDVRFNEMEYSVPAERGIECLDAVLEVVRASGEPVLFPFEFRYVAAEDGMLSPFHQQAAAAISIHRYYKADPTPLFSLVEPILQNFGGRPHWGKMHTMRGAQLRERYPRWDDFQKMRRELDAQGRMLNAHMRQLFDVSS